MTMTVKWHGEKAKAAVRRGAKAGLTDAAEYVLEQSNRVVPIEDSTLLKSGVPSVDEGSLRAAVSYDTPYAVRQHEELDYQHDAGRKAKYLEGALNESRTKVNALIAAAIKRELR